MKTCPICKARCFEDMEICYGCMHRFMNKETPEFFCIPNPVTREQEKNTESKETPLVLEVLQGERECGTRGARTPLTSREEDPFQESVVCLREEKKEEEPELMSAHYQLVISLKKTEESNPGHAQNTISLRLQ